MIKLMFCLRRLPHLSRAEFQAYWRDVHAPLVFARAQVMNLKVYIQHHALADKAVERMAACRGSPPSFDGIAELHWDLTGERTEAHKDAARRANAELLDDERRFIDLTASPIFLVEDHEVIREFVESREAYGL